MAENLKDRGPKAAETKSQDLEAVVQEQARQLEELRAMLFATIRAQPAVSPDTIWAQNHQKEVAIKEELDRLAKYFLESTEQRSQWEANKVNPDGKRLFRVSLGWCPELVVRANDEVSARAYYDKICGISGVRPNHAKPETTTYVIADVTDDPASQAKAGSKYELKAAA